MVIRMPLIFPEGVVMTVSSAIARESSADRIIRRMIPFAVVAGLVALILAPGLVDWTSF